MRKDCYSNPRKDEVMDLDLALLLLMLLVLAMLMGYE